MHYYTYEGVPCHTVVGSNKKTRSTSLRDARKLNLFPSATTILSLLSKDALIGYFRKQILEAAINNPFHPEMSNKDEWCALIASKSDEHRNKAAEMGNKVHSWMESYFGEGVVQQEEYTSTAIGKIHHLFPDYKWQVEKTFAHPLGFGGSVDLHGVNNSNEWVVIDYKTKDVEDLNKVIQYEEHKLQLSGYMVGLDLPKNTRMFNCFISVNEHSKGECVFVEHKEHEKYRKMFCLLVEYWKLKNDYSPKM